MTAFTVNGRRKPPIGFKSLAILSSRAVILVFGRRRNGRERL